MVPFCPQNNVLLCEISDLNPSAKPNAQRQQTISPVRSFPAASWQSPFDDDSRDDDDGLFLSECDADVAESESFVPRDCLTDAADADAVFLLLSLGEPREEVLSWERGESTIPALLPTIAVAAGCGAASGPSLSSSNQRFFRVRFSRELVAVAEIPSHRSLTAKERHSMYRDKRTVHIEKEIALLERAFERSRYCSENALEEESFFRNFLGELVHPAHWVAFLRDIYPSFAREPFAPPGFSSAKEYYDHLSQYKRFYRRAVEENDFPPPEL